MPAVLEVVRRRGGTVVLVLFRWLLLLGGLIVFVLLAAALRRERELWFDGPVQRAVAGWRSAGLDFAMSWVTRFGNGEVLALVAIVASVVLWRVGRSRAALFVGLSAAGSGAMNQILKLLFERPRPGTLQQISTTDGFSFPSGHSMVSATVFGALAIVIVMRFPRTKLSFVSLAALLVFAIGLSRVYLGVHYASDVLAGWGLGLCWPLWLRPLLLAKTSVVPAPREP